MREAFIEDEVRNTHLSTSISIFDFLEFMCAQNCIIYIKSNFHMAFDDTISI